MIPQPCQVFSFANFGDNCTVDCIIMLIIHQSSTSHRIINEPVYPTESDITRMADAGAAIADSQLVTWGVASSDAGNLLGPFTTV